MKVRSAAIGAVLILLLLTGCAKAETGAAGKESAAPASPAATVTSGLPAESASSGAAPSGSEAEPAPSGAADPKAAAPGSPTGAADPKEAGQVLDGILNQLDQLDQLYSEMDEVSDDDLNVN